MSKRAHIYGIIKEAYPDKVRLNTTSEALGFLGLNKVVDPKYAARLLYYASALTGHRYVLAEKIEAQESFITDQQIENNPVEFIAMLIKQAQTVDVQNLLIDCNTGLCLAELGNPAKVVRFPERTLEPIQDKEIAKMVMIPGSFLKRLYREFLVADMADQVEQDYANFAKILTDEKA